MSNPQVYDSAKRPPPAIEELREAVKYRHMIKEFVRRDITTRYKRSFLGVLWTMLNPMGTMLIMTVVFYQIFSVKQPNYPIYVFVGLICWNFFSQVSEAAPKTLLWSGPLIHRVYVPRTVFSLVAVGGGLVNLVLTLVPLSLVMFALKAPPKWPALFVPVAMLFLAAFALGVGLLLSSVVVHFPDVLDIYSIFMTAWLYMSAIFYPYDIIPETYRWWFFNLNPMYHLVLLFRDPLYYGNWPTLAHVATAGGVAFGTLALGWFVFTRKADELGYRI